MNKQQEQWLMDHAHYVPNLAYKATVYARVKDLILLPLCRDFGVTLEQAESLLGEFCRMVMEG